jgi:bacterioferritin-associated ferredoxin
MNKLSKTLRALEDCLTNDHVHSALIELAERVEEIEVRHGWEDDCGECACTCVIVAGSAHQVTCPQARREDEIEEKPTPDKTKVELKQTYCRAIDGKTHWSAVFRLTGTNGWEDTVITLNEDRFVWQALPGGQKVDIPNCLLRPTRKALSEAFPEVKELLEGAIGLYRGVTLDGHYVSRWAIVGKAEPPSVSEGIIAGALFDFAASLTTLDEDFPVGAKHDAVPVVEALKAFAKARGLSLDDAHVKDWQDFLAETGRRAKV